MKALSITRLRDMLEVRQWPSQPVRTQPWQQRPCAPALTSGPLRLSEFKDRCEVGLHSRANYNGKDTSSVSNLRA